MVTVIGAAAASSTSGTLRVRETRLAKPWAFSSRATAGTQNAIRALSMSASPGPRRVATISLRAGRAGRHSQTRPRRQDGRVSVPAAGTALLLIDVINDLAFEGSEALVAQAEPMATRLAALKRRATFAGMPAIYINDNFGQWRSDFRQTVAHCTKRTSPGRLVSQRLRPTARDYFVLKPKHSGFFDTTLDTLLKALQIRRVLLTGIAGNICVLFTANDAYMRELSIFVPADCIVSNTPSENEQALQQIATVLKGNLAPSTQLAFRRDVSRRKGRSS
jgi:nicotinamidase-related amidase